MKYFWIVVTIVVCILYAIQFFYANKISKPHYYYFEREEKLILLWNSFFEAPNWYLAPNDNDGPFILKCPTTSCVVTSNHNIRPDIRDFDAIVFHGRGRWPLLSQTEKVPTVRGHHQRFIFAVMESPFNTPALYAESADQFNWTMTYRLDSDITIFYGGFVDENDTHVAPAVNPKWLDPVENFTDAALLQLISKKTKKIAWLVSDCNTQSKREKLVQEIQKYMPVHIYGSCGHLKCPHSIECMEMLQKTYKFYLAFENSLCTDYVTEKLFKYMNYNIVPIVYGGANYSRFAPPYSYINVDDFDSVIELVQYLEFLDGNPEEYWKYFWWKKHYTVREHIGMRFSFCRLCEKLHSPENEKNVQVHKNIYDWWNPEIQCPKKPF